MAISYLFIFQEIKSGDGGGGHKTILRGGKVTETDIEETNCQPEVKEGGEGATW